MKSYRFRASSQAKSNSSETGQPDRNDNPAEMKVQMSDETIRKPTCITFLD